MTAGGTFSIRVATEADVPVILDLIRALAEYEKLSDEVTATSEQLRIQLFREPRHAEALLACEDQCPIGVALFFHNFSTFLAKPGLYVEDIFVLPEYRGKGYGRALMIELARLAWERGCGRMEWSVLDWNQPAIDFYRSLGAVPMSEWTIQRVSGPVLEALAHRPPFDQTTECMRSPASLSINFPDVTDLAGYQALYPKIASAVGSPREEPAPEELAFLDRAISTGLPPGNVGPANLYFLAALTSAVDARQALEIGTASGTSSALLAAIIASNRADAQADGAGTLVETIDYKEYCRFDESKPIGFMVRELVPELSSQVRIHTLRDSAFAQGLFPARTLDLAFIDGNHQHPWPLLDVLRVLPLMRSGGWMILHDIDLPAVAVRLGIEARFGAQWVFENWPLAKIFAGNIGAVTVPADFAGIRPCLEQLAAKPYEVAETGWKRYRRMVARAMEALYPS